MFKRIKKYTKRPSLSRQPLMKQRNKKLVQRKRSRKSSKPQSRIPKTYPSSYSILSTIYRISPVRQLSTSANLSLQRSLFKTQMTMRLTLTTILLRSSISATPLKAKNS